MAMKFFRDCFFYIRFFLFNYSILLNSAKIKIKKKKIQNNFTKKKKLLYFLKNTIKLFYINGKKNSIKSIKEHSFESYNFFGISKKKFFFLKNYIKKKKRRKFIVFNIFEL
jgi:hypothetical protein